MAEQLRPGMQIEVRTGFDRGWAKGFEVAELLEGGALKVRRVSDGSEVPVPFSAEDIRRPRRSDNVWWV